MKHIVASLFALFILAPTAHAERCKPAGMEYMHAFEQRPNWVIWWWCDNTHWQWAPIIPEDTSTEKIVAFNAFAFGLNPGWFNEPSDRPADDPLMVSLRDAAHAFAASDAHRPPAPPVAAWAVAKNASYKDRPTYPVVNGVRSTKSDGRVDVGTACDCSTPIVEGKTTYCQRVAAPAAGLISPPPASKSVAVCVQQGG